MEKIFTIDLKHVRSIPKFPVTADYAISAQQAGR